MSWLNPISDQLARLSKRHAGAQPRREKNRYRPSLELLEDRVCPSDLVMSALSASVSGRTVTISDTVRA